MNKKIISSSLLILLLSLSGCGSADNTSNDVGENTSTNEVVDSLTSSNEQASITSGNEASSNTSSGLAEWVDYTANFVRTLDDFDETSKVFTTGTIKIFVDGDTTHFNVSSSVIPGGVLEARYNGVDTPESTGQVEPWGKKASEFTKSKLSDVSSIIIESEDTKWNVDSSSSRYMTWIWYMPSGSNTYRLLNLELLQEGFSIAKNLSSFTYGEVLRAANLQAQAYKLKYAGKQTDPDYTYGDATNITMKELRTNITQYADTKVRVEGLVTVVNGYTSYAEAYDVETQMSYGIQVYAGYTSYEQIKVGNVVSFCGFVTYYETSGVYQLTGLHYYAMRPNHTDNLQLISSGNDVSATKVTADDLSTKGSTICSTYVELENLTVKSIYTTSSDSSTSNGAMTLTCEDESGNEVIVRTSVLFEEDGKTLVTASKFQGKKINAVGIVDIYSGEYQVHVFLLSDITIIE